jgi:predicted enzyme related to lactoylglutathione lyase
MLTTNTGAPLTALRILTAVFIVLILFSCSSMTINMPAVTDEPGGQRLPGKIVWHELITDTPDESRRFYEELFGWKFEDLGINLGFTRTVNYTLIRHQGKLIGGLIDQNLLATKADISQWMVLLSVEDVDAATRHVESSGGTVFNPPTDLAERGRMSIVSDPQGAMLALLETRGGDPADVAEVAAGGFLWNELWTDDTGAATEFYQGLAEYEYTDRELDLEGGSTTYRVLSVGETPRAGMITNPVEGLIPVWVTYIRATDDAALDSIVAKVENLGGSLLLAPQDRAIGGRVALIADPSGAGIAIQTWPASAGESK